MEQVTTASADKKTLVETLTTMQPLEPIWQNKNFVQSPNRDHPDASFAVSGQEDDEDNIYVSEGWRYIKTTTADGQVSRERVPLTPYELLHPKEDYAISHHTTHTRNTHYLKTTIGHHLKKNSNAHVFRYLQIDFNLPGIEPVSPDISVIFNIVEEKAWSTFNCQKEGTYPSVIFEVTSPDTRKGDFGEKYEYYQWAGVPYYVILDITYDDEEQPLAHELFVYELSDNQYVRMSPNAQGRYWFPSLDISIEMGDKRIHCYDGSGEYLMSHTELARALEKSKKEIYALEKRTEELKRITSEAIQVRLDAEASIAKSRARMAELKEKS